MCTRVQSKTETKNIYFFCERKSNHLLHLLVNFSRFWNNQPNTHCKIATITCVLRASPFEIVGPSVILASYQFLRFQLTCSNDWHFLFYRLNTLIIHNFLALSLHSFSTNPSFSSSSGLIPRTSRTVYRYFWVYSFLCLVSSFPLLFSCWFRAVD